MRSDIRAEMELKIENVTRKAETNIKKCSDTRNAEIEKIKVDAMKKAQSIEAKEVGENTMIVFKSHRRGLFTRASVGAVENSSSGFGNKVKE